MYITSLHISLVSQGFLTLRVRPTTCMELFYDSYWLFFYVLKQVSIYCSCLRRTLRRWFAVKLLKCFCRWRKPPLTFHQHVGEEITAVFTYFSRVNCSFKIQTCWPWARHPAGGSSGGCSCRTDSQPGFKNTQKTGKKRDQSWCCWIFDDLTWRVMNSTHLLEQCQPEAVHLQTKKTREY